MHLHIHTGSCDDIVYMPSYHNISQANYMGAATERDCGDQENIIYRPPLRHLVMRLLDSDVWLEYDHCRTPTCVYARSGRSSGLGGRICVPRCSCRDGIWYDIAVSDPASRVQQILKVNSIASCILFGVLAAVRRPFEAHLFKHGYRTPADPFGTPAASRNPSPMRRSTRASREQPRGRRMSTSTRKSTSDSDVETLNLSHSPPPPTLHAPSPQRSFEMGVFTSHFVPPPIPPHYFAPTRNLSIDSNAPYFPSSASHRMLTVPPRLSGLASSSCFIPLSTAPQYSASSWRALHPNSPSSMGLASRSYPYLPSSALSHHSCYSRSSVSISITKPTPAESIAWSLRSGSTGPEGRGTPIFSEDNTDRRASASEITSALVNGTPIPGTTRPQTRGKGHKRNISAPDTTDGAQKPNRMAMGWKPQLTVKTQESDKSASETLCVPTKLPRIVRSSSAELLSRFSPDTSPESDEKTPQGELERNLDLRARVMKELPFRRSRSADPMVCPDVTTGAAWSVKEEGEMRGGETKLLHPEVGRKWRTRFEEVKNKPLPKIAIL
jgi:hypothetical protein